MSAPAEDSCMHLDPDQLRLMLRQMYEIRAFEEAAGKLYKRGMLKGGVHACIGQEAIPVGVSLHLRLDDYITSTHRGHGHHIAKGADVKRLMAELMGKETGYCKGRGGSMHVAACEVGSLGAFPIVAAGVPSALGAALSFQMRGTDQVVVAYFGDGALGQGTIYEAFNLAGGMAAWGDHYEVRVVEETPRLTILQISRPARGCLSYLLASGGDAMVVDPARHIEIYTRIAAERELRITGVLDTHLQADHLSGGVALAKAVGADYWLHPYDSIYPDDLLPATFSFRYLEDGTTFKLGKVSVRALHLPGHTLGMINPLVDDRFLLSGDTLFIDSIGRPDLGGKAKAWIPLLLNSLKQVLELPDRTIVLPAHFSHMHEADEQGCYRAPISALRSRNEGLRMLSQGLAAFSAYIEASLPEHPQSYDDIRRVNTGLLQVDEAKASELELGRNRCALSQREAEKQA